MTASNLPPDLANELSRIKQRLDVIERRLNKPFGPGAFPEIVFSCAGPLNESVGAESEVWSAPLAARITNIWMQVRVAGTSDVTVDVFRNGTVILTVTLPAGTTSTPMPCSITMAPNTDRIWMRLVSGGGASDLSVSARY